MQKNPPKHAPLDRRGFLEGIAAGVGGMTLAGCGGGGGGGGEALPPPFEQPLPPSTASTRNALPRPPLPAAATSGIDRIVLVTMENRSFDHFLGWVPRAEGLQANLRYSDAFGDIRPTFALAPESGYGFASCGRADPNHSYDAGRKHFGDGKMNGWLLTADTSKTRGDRLPIGYYRAEDLPFYSAAANEYTVCDYYFSGILSETYPNRVYLHSGQTDRLDNSLVTSTLPTIWDRLADKSITRGYYYHDTPFLALFGVKYNDISKKIDAFYADAAAGTLPSFSMVDPRFGGESAGTSNDDHPHADVRNGQAFVSKVYDTLRASPTWATTLMVVVYDEWGGFFEHVAPPIRPVSAEEKTLGNDGRLGFRVPCILFGPRVRKAFVSQYPFDPSSIHKLLEWRFGLAPLGVRGTDSATLNLAYSLDFSSAPRADRVQLPLPAEVAAGCPSTVLPGSTPTDASTADRKSTQAIGSDGAELPGGRFHGLWLKAQANGFAL